jgi:uncharacterized membrane protein YtjA (UPF0391 family)
MKPVNLHTATKARTDNALRQTSITLHKEKAMLYYAIVFLVIALIAGFLGFFGIAGLAASIAKILFVVFVVLFVVSLIFGRRRRL